MNRYAEILLYQQMVNILTHTEVSKLLYTKDSDAPPYMGK